MAQFPHLETESIVQVNDKTRFDGTRSFVTTGSTALTAVSFTPQLGATPITITSGTSSDWILDYAYDQDGTPTFDIITGSNDEIEFSEGASELTATIPQLNYTRATLATAIKTAMDTAGALTYTVTVSSSNVFTIAATGNFELLTKTGTSVSPLLAELGFTDSTEDQTGAATYTADEAMESGRKLVTLEVDDGSIQTTTTREITIKTPTGDKLFSADADIVPHEPDIMGYVRAGRNTYLDVHRAAKERILGYLDERGFTDVNGDRLTDADIVDIQEVREWSKFLTLQLIFEGLSNAIDDIFAEKASKYRNFVDGQVRNRAIFRLDFDNDGVIEDNEKAFVQTVALLRR